MSAPLVPADSTVDRDAASSVGTSSALLRLIRMRRLSDLGDSSAAGVAWADPALAPAAWSDAIPTLLRSPRPASASAVSTRRFPVRREFRAELLQDLLHHVVIQRTAVRRDGDPHPLQFRDEITVFHPELLSQCIHAHEKMTPTPLYPGYPASDSDSLPGLLIPALGLLPADAALRFPLPTPL